MTSDAFTILFVLYFFHEKEKIQCKEMKMGMKVKVNFFPTFSKILFFKFQRFFQVSKTFFHVFKDFISSFKDFSNFQRFFFHILKLYTFSIFLWKVKNTVQRNEISSFMGMKVSSVFKFYFQVSETFSHIFKKEKNSKFQRFFSSFKDFFFHIFIFFSSFKDFSWFFIPHFQRFFYCLLR